jgi:hypothetical protein
VRGWGASYFFANTVGFGWFRRDLGTRKDVVPFRVEPFRFSDVLVQPVLEPIKSVLHWPAYENAVLR